MWSCLQELWREILPGKARLPAPTSAGLQRWAESCISLGVCVTVSEPQEWCLLLVLFSLGSMADVGSGASGGARRGDVNNFQEWLRMAQRHLCAILRTWKHISCSSSWYGLVLCGWRAWGIHLTWFLLAQGPDLGCSFGWRRAWEWGFAHYWGFGEGTLLPSPAVFLGLSHW